MCSTFIIYYFTDVNRFYKYTFISISLHFYIYFITRILTIITITIIIVKFRGEFGVLSDDASVSLYDTDTFNITDKIKKLQEKTTALGLTEVLGVPFEDLRHLRALFPGGKKNRDTGVLSARLFSLKLDLKDA